MRLGIVTIPRQLPPGGGSVADHLTGFAQQVEKLDFHGLWLTDAFGRGRMTRPAQRHGHALRGHQKDRAWHVRHPGADPPSGGARTPRADHQSSVQWAVSFRDRHRLDQGRLRRRPGRFRDSLQGPAWHAGGDAPYLEWRGRVWASVVRLARHRGRSAGPSGRLAQSALDQSGGKRAIVANIFADFRENPEGSPIGRPLTISLICSPAEARERLKRLADTGVDDALVVCPFEDPAQLETIRGLI
jgi:hypothetical protein